MRIAPGDHTRIVFGGLTGEIDADLRIMGERLHQRLLRVFPELGDLQFDHVWTGKCGGTFDITPRIGCHEGVHYGSGYCFAGVPMGTLFGRKIARRILGQEGGESVFDTEPPTQVLVSRQCVVRAPCAEVDEPERPVRWPASLRARCRSSIAHHLRVAARPGMGER